MNDGKQVCAIRGRLRWTEGKGEEGGLVFQHVLVKLHILANQVHWIPNEEISHFDFGIFNLHPAERKSGGKLCNRTSRVNGNVISLSLCSYWYNYVHCLVSKYF